MLTEARVIKANGQTGFAIFDSEFHSGKVVLILDKEPDPSNELYKVYYHPRQEALRAEKGKIPEYHYLGEPIDLRPYLELPESRRGFRMSDD